MGRCDACWWILSGWFPGYKIVPGDATRHWCPPSCLWPVVLLWVSALVCLRPAILGISISCRQYWPYKGLRRLALFVDHPRNSGAEIKCRSHSWKLDADVMGRKIEGWALLSWYWSANFANNERFGHFQLGAHLPYPGFFAEILTKYLQLHLLCPSGSQFKNGIGKALGSSKLIWSSSSSYLWSDKGCCDLWEQALCVCILPNSDAIFWRLWQ